MTKGFQVNWFWKLLTYNIIDRIILYVLRVNKLIEIKESLYVKYLIYA